MRYKKTDYLLFALLVISILTVSFMALTNTCYWDDDWAAYITEGIAITEGRLDEQAALNVIMHPSELPDEALDGSLVYVWGYPLLLALVYKLVGFDRVAFSSIIYYKIPSAIALALLAGVMYLFLRRRFGKTISFLLSFLFCACYEFRVFINTLYSDMVFLFFAMLSLFVLEVFLDEKRQSRRLALGFMLGAALWYTYEVRLNGISILFACAVACVAFLIRERRERPEGIKLKNELAVILLPFAVFLVLKLVSEAILSPATGNTSDLAGFTFQTFINNLVGYYNQLRTFSKLIFDDAAMNWVGKLWAMMTETGEDTYGIIAHRCDIFSEALVTITLLLALGGLILDGFKRELHLTLFMIAYMIVVCMLPYNQGTRYIYPVLIVVPVYIGHVCRRLACLLTKPIDALRLTRICRALGVLCTVCACALTLTSAVRGIEYERAHDEPLVPSGPWDFYSMYAYSPCAREIYNYIITNTPDDAVIGFEKPRAMYLNTGRLSICTNSNSHSLDEVDYFLTCAQVGEDQLKDEGNGRFEEIFENAEFVLYEKVR